MQRTAFRPIRAEIDLAALQHNYAEVRRLTAHAKVWAVIKANAYGHGLVSIAKALPQAEGFAVASLEEALTLREAGITHPILLLEGAYQATEYPLIFQQQLSTVIHSPEQLCAFENYLENNVNKASKNAKIPSPDMAVWFKFDTGMHRLGFLAEALSQVESFIQRFGSRFSYGVMSHFATADEDIHFAQQQLDLFHKLSSQLMAIQKQNPSISIQKSMANSAAIQNMHEAHFDWVRPGIMLYGSGIKRSQQSNVSLQPVMRLKTEVIALKWVEAGACIGYGCDAQLTQRTLVAIAAVGYGDGYPRSHVKGQGEGLNTSPPIYCEGAHLPRLGRVSMDMLAFDASAVSKTIRIGSEVELWGEHLDIEAIAEQCGTISYELLCAVTARVPRVYLEAEAN